LIQFGIKTDNSGVAFNLHDVDHGLTPCDFSHLRTLETAPLSVIGAG
jgi:hypothetical protein